MAQSRSIIITGGNTGLGFQAAKAVIADPSVVAVIACRNPDLGREAVSKLEACGGRAIFLALDLGDQASVREFVGRFKSVETAAPLQHYLQCRDPKRRRAAGDGPRI